MAPKLNSAQGPVQPWNSPACTRPKQEGWAWENETTGIGELSDISAHQPALCVA